MLAALTERIDQYVSNVGEDLQNGNTTPYEEITELTLDGRSIRTISVEDAEELNKFKNLSKLTLNQTGLTSLKALPLMPQIRYFEATDNHISEGLNDLCMAFPNLKRLQLGGNHIKTFQDLSPLASLKSLEHLGLDLNPVSTLENYRENIFNIIPSLILLDSIDCQGKENEEAAESDEEDEDFEDDEPDTTLKEFYEGDLEDDEEEFEPGVENEEDEEIDDDEEEEEEEDEEFTNEEENANKRKNEDAVDPEAQKHIKLQ